MTLLDSGPISLDDLQNYKALDPLLESSIIELTRIQSMDVEEFSEADVRGEIIDPIIRILGYSKGSIFSLGREKKIDFLDKRKFIDYSFMLWQQNFWLIEAKKPKESKKQRFGYQDLRQAVEYAIHPDINAALVVLCDGYKIEIFDREVSITEPALHVKIHHLLRDFDKIRYLLGPWQIWFFYKRRVIRVIDKVFDYEFNLERVDEFKSLIERRLDGKRSVILNNYRAQIKYGDAADSYNKHLRTADTVELVDVHFFFEHNESDTYAMVETLVNRCETNSFRVLYKIFPDEPRDANDSYYAHALSFLMNLTNKRSSLPWLPIWLSKDSETDNNSERAVQHLLILCLTNFTLDKSRKIVLLASAAFRRLFKLLAVIEEKQWRLGQMLHFIERYSAPEISWRQIISSPAQHILNYLDNATMLATTRFVKECRNKQGRFLSQVAERRVREVWDIEKAILNSVSDYPSLLRERDLGEMHPTEATNVICDFLGHFCLCLIKHYPGWMTYALENHRSDIEAIASMGSWQARNLLGINSNSLIQPVPESVIAERFFFGDISTLTALKKGYGL